MSELRAAQALPGFINTLLAEDQATALLQLATHHTLNLDHTHIHSTVEANNKQYTYTLTGVFGDNGRALAFQPNHEPDTLVIAFRATRVNPHAMQKATMPNPQTNKQTANRNRNRRIPVATNTNADVKTVLCTNMVGAKWLPASARVHAGVLDYHFDIWGGDDHSARRVGCGAGLLEFLSNAHRNGNFPQRVLLVGLSLGAALAQITALRLSLENSPFGQSFARSIFVFACGGLQWADCTSANLYRKKLADRAVMFISYRLARESTESMKTWCLSEPDVAGGCKKVKVLDPIVVRYGSTSAVHNVFSLLVEVESEAPSTRLKQREVRTTMSPLDPDVFASATAPLPALSALLTGQIPRSHALRSDYFALHLSRHYKTIVDALSCQRGKSRDHISRPSLKRHRNDELTLGEDCPSIAEVAPFRQRSKPIKGIRKLKSVGWAAVGASRMARISRDVSTLDRRMDSLGLLALGDPTRDVHSEGNALLNVRVTRSFSRESVPSSSVEARKRPSRISHRKRHSSLRSSSGSLCMF